MIIKSFVIVDSTLFITIEFTHVWLFFVALSYIVHAMCLMIIARKTKTQYDNAAHTQTDQLILQYTQYNDTTNTINNKLKRYIYTLIEPLCYSQIRYHIQRLLFINEHNLDNDFDFSKYIRRNMSYYIIHHLDIRLSTWFIVLIIIFINFLRLQSTTNNNTNNNISNYNSSLV